jgi:predicted dehydrogenase
MTQAAERAKCALSDKDLPMKTAFLSALGMMGRRHLKGLVRAGFFVSAYDVNDGLEETVRTELLAAGLPIDRVKFPREIPSGDFDVAVFAETTVSRLANFQRFLSFGKAARILVEKPMSADPEEVRAFQDIAEERGVAGSTQVNFVRRHWPHLHRLAERCAVEEKFTVTLNGGAVGLGCMGIHYLDTFLALSGDEVPDVTWSELSKTPVASGRGVTFTDFGGDFVLSSRRARLLASLEAGSSANVLMSVRGANFLAQVDYTDMRWKISSRKPDSVLPNYRYGADYVVVEEGPVNVPAMDAITHDWALGLIELPGLAQALKTHDLLDRILQAGGARPPYQYT